MKEEIKQFVKGDVADDEESLKKYSHDASLLEVTPELVVFPKDVEDIKNLVRFVRDRKKENPTLSITPRAAGTCMSGGPLNDSIILDVNKYMQGTLSVSAEAGHEEAVVLPGTFYRDFEKKTLEKGVFLPSYTASKELCAVGGMVGNNSGGEKTLAYGKTEDYINKLKVIFSDGNEYVVKPLAKPELDIKMSQNDFEGSIYKRVFELVEKNKDLLASAKPKVSKNSAGYFLWNVWDGVTFDLNKLLVGSQGTLAITTEITFKLVPVKKYSKLYVIFLKSLDPVAKLVNEILPFKPESFESYDDHTLMLAIKFMPDMVRTMKTSFLKLMWSFLPEAWMMVTGGMPKLVVLVEFADDSESAVNDKMQKLDAHLAPFHLKTRVTASEEESKKYWTIRRESFNLLRKHVKNRRTAPFIDDIIVRPEHLPEFMPKLTEILDRYKLVYTIAGHVGNGNFHIIPLMDMRDPREKGIIMNVSSEVYKLVLEYKGSITAEHGDGIVRTPYLPKMYGEEIMALFKEVKNIFDPQNILNPGKKVGSTLRYFKDHIVAE
ncbi:MAG: FAD-binding oxidoreductase [Candidatus Taylorbacteria bacterium]